MWRVPSPGVWENKERQEEKAQLTPGAALEVEVLRAARAQTRGRGAISCPIRPRLMVSLSYWKPPRTGYSRKPTGLATLEVQLHPVKRPSTRHPGSGLDGKVQRRRPGPFLRVLQI